jgi:hypothetical protein
MSAAPCEAANRLRRPSDASQKRARPVFRGGFGWLDLALISDPGEEQEDAAALDLFERSHLPATRKIGELHHGVPGGDVIGGGNTR